MITGEKYRIRLKILFYFILFYFILFYYLSIQNDELKSSVQIKIPTLGY